MSNARCFLLARPIALAVLLCLIPLESRGEAVRSPRPNVVLILADDLGFSDLGCYGGEIETPHLDALAANGLRFTQFYNTGRCWPTRAALLTGYYAQQVRRDALPGVDPSGARGRRPEWAPLASALLRRAGYRCYHSGKWHLDGLTLASGFDASYYLRDQGRYFSPRVHFENDERLPRVEPDSGFYATRAIADRAVAHLRRHAEQESDAPFFLYLAFTSPHFPLHALPEDIAKYRERYREGWGSIRARRAERQRRLELLEARLASPERDVGPPYHFPDALRVLGAGEVNRPLPWETLNDAQRRFQADKMAIHAAMIDRMDHEIGKVLRQLRRMEAWENTLILFLSDNGASAEIMVRSDGHDPKAPRGSAASYLCLGPGWSTVSNTPFRRHKTWVHEGGIATPLIVHWPRGRFPSGVRHTPGHVIDIAPTLLSLAGAERPDLGGPKPPGRDLSPLFQEDIELPERPLWWSHEGNQALRLNQWKVVRSADAPWELYDLGGDRSETNNRAHAHPDRVAALVGRWEAMQRMFVGDLQR